LPVLGISGLAVTQDGACVALSHREYSTTLPNWLDSELGGSEVVMCFDAAGDVRWSRTLDGFDAHVSNLSADAQGNLYVVGNFSDELHAAKNLQITANNLPAVNGVQQVAPDAFLVSYTSDGAPRFARHYGGTKSDVATNVAITDDGRALLAGTFMDQMTVGKTTLTADNASDPFPFLISVSSDGSEQWTVRSAKFRSDVSGLAAGPNGEVATVVQDDNYQRVLARFDAQGTPLGTATLDRLQWTLPSTPIARVGDGYVVGGTCPRDDNKMLLASCLQRFAADLSVQWTAQYLNGNEALTLAPAGNDALIVAGADSFVASIQL
jgi:hypothetical protein